MKETRILMGMPITVEIVDISATQANMNAVFDYFDYVDKKFSTFKSSSEISKINGGLVAQADWSADMREVFELSEKTRQETDGYFNILTNENKFDPSGLVKGWAIYRAAQLLQELGLKNFYIEAGGDIQVIGASAEGKPWSVGIRNPFNVQEIVKAVYLKNKEGIATSGNYERGHHIYNPKDRALQLTSIVSLTVIGPNIYEADRFATAAFAMQEQGIAFIENLPGFEGYMINKEGQATMTSNFETYTIA